MSVCEILSLCERIIHNVFTPLKLGQLTMELPSGEKRIYGDDPNGICAHIRIKNRKNFFSKCVLYGDVGFGEAYVDGDWDTDDVTAVIRWMIHNVEHHPTLMADNTKNTPVNWFRLFNTWAHLLRDNSLTGSRKNISAHYDLGNEFFNTFLDPTMAYSSAYFTKPDQTMQEGQKAKFDIWCQKLRLKPTDHVLEIGGGWGGFALHAAKNYGCKVTPITISQEQYNYSKDLFKANGVDHLVDVQFIDYRNITGQYDKIISIEMIEAVGHKFLPVYFKQITNLLKPDGVVGLQMIMSPDHRYESFRSNVDWIQKHIFPGSLLPSMRMVHECLFETGNLNIFDYEDISPSYARTLKMWRERFNLNRQELGDLGFDETFVRKWNYYFAYCEAAFSMRNIAVVQAVFSRPNNYQLI